MRRKGFRTGEKVKKTAVMGGHTNCKLNFKQSSSSVTFTLAVHVTFDRLG